jgi:hypothetical protein
MGIKSWALIIAFIIGLWTLALADCHHVVTTGEPLFPSIRIGEGRTRR